MTLRKSSASRDFNPLFFSLAHGASAFAYEFLTFFMTLHLYDLTASALDMGILLAVSFVPRLFSPFYGALTDRLPQNTSFASACLLAAISVVLLAGQRSPSGIYAAWFITSTLAMVILNLRTAIMTRVMPGKRFVGANSLALILLNVARLAAPSCAALLARNQSPTLILSVAATTYLLAAITAAQLRFPCGNAASPSKAENARASLWNGLKTIRRTRDLATLAGIAIIWRLCLGFQGALMIVYVKQGLGGSAAEFAAISIAAALGSIAGGAIGPLVVRRCSPHQVVLIGLNLHFVLVAAFGFISDYPVALINAFTANLVLYSAVVAVHSIRDVVTDRSIRGRVFGCITALTGAPALVSMLLGGLLADRWGIRPVFIAGGITAVVACFPLFLLARHAIQTSHTLISQQP